MLPGELVKLVGDTESSRLELRADLGLGHLVERFDRNLRILPAELHQRKLPCRREALADPGEHRLGVGELVVDIDTEHEIDLAGGEAGIDR